MGFLKWTLFFTILCFVQARNIKNVEPSLDPKGDIHVLLVAGSNGWWNYRHQADIAHAYQLVKKNGIPEENIIVMMYDDIANSRDNPYPGKLFNRPHGPDVYQGVKIDYKGDSVTPQNFMNILLGNAQNVTGGNRRVINSKPSDRIFIYFADHGGFGLICFPNDNLSKKDLINTLTSMHQQKRYNQLVFYMEACESGSMFDGALTSDMNIYAMTAANPDESSWGTYCDETDLPCLGDLFSVNWMEDTEEHNVNLESLETQYEDVKKMTDLSHVMQYGDLALTGEKIKWFEAEQTKPLNQKQQRKTSVPVRDIELMHLQRLQKSVNSPMVSYALQQRIDKIHEDRRNIEVTFNSVVANLLANDNDRKEMFEKRNAIEDLKCHNDVVKTFDSICVDVNKFDYALKYIYVLNNLCVKIGDSEKIISAMHKTCSTIGKQYL